MGCSPLHPPRHERRRHAPPPGEPPPPAAEPLPRLALRGHAVAGAPRAGTPPPRPQASSHPLLRPHAALAAAAPLRAWSGEAVPLRFGSPLPCTPAMAPHGRRCSRLQCATPRRCYRLPCATPRGRPERSSTPLRAPPLVHLRVAAGPSGAGEGVPGPPRAWPPPRAPPLGPPRAPPRAPPCRLPHAPPTAEAGEGRARSACSPAHGARPSGAGCGVVRRRGMQGCGRRGMLGRRRAGGGEPGEGSPRN